MAHPCLGHAQRVPRDVGAQQRQWALLQAAARQQKAQQERGVQR